MSFENPNLIHPILHLQIFLEVKFQLFVCLLNNLTKLNYHKLLNDEDGNNVRITYTDEEKSFMNNALIDFVKEPLTYDLHEMVSDEEMQEMAQECESLRRELCK